MDHMNEGIDMRHTSAKSAGLSRFGGMGVALALCFGVLTLPALAQDNAAPMEVRHRTELLAMVIR